MLRSTSIRKLPRTSSTGATPGNVTVGANPGEGTGSRVSVVAVGFGGGGNPPAPPANALHANDENKINMIPNPTIARSLIITSTSTSEPSVPNYYSYG